MKNFAKAVNRRLHPAKRKLTKKLNIGLTSRRKLERLKSYQKHFQLLEPEGLLDYYLSGSYPKLTKIVEQSKSQISQDIFVAFETMFKERGFFVEFGATNGFDLSNTWMLENLLGWNGILAEPAINWHRDLKANRKCAIEFDCVWTNTGENLTFNQTADKELSTLAKFNDRDGHAAARSFGKTYTVSTISLLDLLKKHKAPKEIDYLSIDTEGSEFEILNAFDFDAYDIRIITCEHNYTEDREKINKLLTAKGYKRKLENLSQFDDWYVRN